MGEEVIKSVITAIQGLYNPSGTSPLNPVSVDPGLSPVRSVSGSADNFNSAVKLAGKTVASSSPTASGKGSSIKAGSGIFEGMGGGGEGESGKSGNRGEGETDTGGISPGSAAEGNATV